MSFGIGRFPTSLVSRLRSFLDFARNLQRPFDFAQGGFLSTSHRGGPFDFARGKKFLQLRPGLFIFDLIMIPDYPHKLFADKRNSYSLLMLTLAMDSVN
ncbi:MAG: hypothetical protein IPL50_19615 [Chitinophagaceae bacterium]|nr:hypothetical protein [Chitinophagaceae bacterium]